MKIRNRLTALFTTLMGALLLIFALVIYFSFSKNRQQEYYSSLKHAAITKANLLLDAKIQPQMRKTSDAIFSVVPAGAKNASRFSSNFLPNLMSGDSGCNK